MPSVNETNYSIDQTVRVFDTFYSFDLQVPADEYDAVNSYFQAVFTDPVAANNFTTTIFRIARETNTPALTIVQQLNNQDEIGLTLSLSYYLNGLRSPTTLLGINAAVTPNFYTARNVRA